MLLAYCCGEIDSANSFAMLSSSTSAWVGLSAWSHDCAKTEALLDALRQGNPPPVGSVVGRQGSAPASGRTALAEPPEPPPWQAALTEPPAEAPEEKPNAG